MDLIPDDWQEELSFSQHQHSSTERFSPESLRYIWSLKNMLPVGKNLIFSLQLSYIRIPRFQFQEKVTVRFIPTAASQTLIKPFISFPHRVAPPDGDCCVNVALNDEYLTACMKLGILVTFSRPRFTWRPFIWHLSSRFIPADGLFSCSVPAAQWKTAIYCLPTNPISFDFHVHSCSCDFPFFFKQEKIPLEVIWRFKRKKPFRRKYWCLCSHGGFPHTERGSVLCRTFTVHILHDNKQMFHTPEDWKRSYRGLNALHYCLCWENKNSKQSSGSWFHLTPTCLCFKLQKTKQNKTKSH